MRFRLLRRRLTISAPRMAVRSAMPWPLRWVVVAIVLRVFAPRSACGPLSSARTLPGWTRTQGRTGQLRDESKRLREERDKAQSVANTSGSLLTAERATQEKLAEQIARPRPTTVQLADDLGFFEKLIPSPGAEALPSVAAGRGGAARS
jgi:hypothetical protein